MGMTRVDRNPLHWPTIAAAATVLAAIALRVMGVPTIDLHPPLHHLGVMDPLCGGTRATYLLLSGDVAGAARYNPVVFPLAAIVLAVLIRAGVGILTGRWLEVRLSRNARRALLAALGVTLVVLAVRQQLHAELLMQGWPPTDAS